MCDGAGHTVLTYTAMSLKFPIDLFRACQRASYRAKPYSTRINTASPNPDRYLIVIWLLARAQAALSKFISLKLLPRIRGDRMVFKFFYGGVNISPLSFPARVTHICFIYGAFVTICFTKVECERVKYTF